MRWGLAAMMVLSACKSGPPCAFDEPSTDDGDDRKHLLQDQESARAGKTVCPAYFPVTHVKVTADTIEIPTSRKPYVVGTKLTPGLVPQNEELFAKLKQLRGRWGQIHPGEPFPARAAIELDPAVDSARAASVGSMMIGGVYDDHPCR